jgi:hypothetical protein
MDSEAGYYRGEHYTAYTGEVRRLRLAKEYDKALDLLGDLIEATEAEARVERVGVAPWYYEQAARIHRARREIEAEAAVLERFALQKHAPEQVHRNCWADLPYCEPGLALDWCL